MGRMPTAGTTRTKSLPKLPSLICESADGLGQTCLLGRGLTGAQSRLLRSDGFLPLPAHPLVHDAKS